MSNSTKTMIALLACVAGILGAPQASAKTVQVTMTVKEVTLSINGTIIGFPDTMAAWTFDGSIPGKPVRVDEGDTVDFTLVNPAENKNSHAMDFHAAQVSVLDEFAPV